MPYPIGVKWPNAIYSLTQTLTASATPAVYPVDMDGDSWFVCTGLTYISTGVFTCRLLKNDEAYSSAKVNNVNLFGTSQLPHRLLVPLILPPSTAFLAELGETSAANNDVRLAFHGFKCFDKEQAEMIGRKLAGGRTTRRPVEFYQYVIDKAVTASAQMQQSIQILGDADFVIQRIIGNATSTAMSLNFSDSYTSRQYWHDAMVYWLNCIGTAQYPVEIHPRLVKKNSQVMADMLDISAATNTAQLVLEGYKVRD